MRSTPRRRHSSPNPSSAAVVQRRVAAPAPVGASRGRPALLALQAQVDERHRRAGGGAERPGALGAAMTHSYGCMIARHSRGAGCGEGGAQSSSSCPPRRARDPRRVRCAHERVPATASLASVAAASSHRCGAGATTSWSGHGDRDGARRLRAMTLRGGSSQTRAIVVSASAISTSLLAACASGSTALAPDSEDPGATRGAVHHRRRDRAQYFEPAGASSAGGQTRHFVRARCPSATAVGVHRRNRSARTPGRGPVGALG